MSHYPFLIVGDGMAADAAVRGIRELDTESPIGLIGAEKDPPYARPPLSKGLWKGEPLESVWRRTSEVGLDLHLGHRATALDLSAKSVADDRSRVYKFEKLLLATGGTPRRLPYGGDRVICFRTLGDYRRLRQLADEGRTFAVIGGGFIGSEVTAALALQSSKVTMLFPGEGIGARVFPADLARFLVGYFGEKGVAARSTPSSSGDKTSCLVDDRPPKSVGSSAAAAGTAHATASLRSGTPANRTRVRRTVLSLQVSFGGTRTWPTRPSPRSAASPLRSRTSARTRGVASWWPRCPVRVHGLDARARAERQRDPSLRVLGAHGTHVVSAHRIRARLAGSATRGHAGDVLADVDRLDDRARVFRREVNRARNDRRDSEREFQALGNAFREASSGLSAVRPERDLRRPWNRVDDTMELDDFYGGSRYSSWRGRD